MALRNIWAKFSITERLALVGPLQEWIGLCTKIAPVHITSQDRQQVLQVINTQLAGDGGQFLRSNEDWMRLVYDIFFAAPDLCDHQQLNQVVDGPIF